MQRERGNRDEPRRSPPRNKAPKKPQLPPSAGVLATGRAALLSRRDVSRETLDRLDSFVALLLEWQVKTNLVAPSTLPEIWSRHIEDSLQLFDVAPEPSRWVDLGSGAGFPGIVMAILLRDRPNAHVALVDSIDKKAAFLRAVIRATGIPATVHATRIEESSAILSTAEAVSARALAPLDRLCGFVAGHIRPDVPCFFAKGRAHDEEIIDASRQWRFNVVRHPSVLGDESVLLEVRDIQAV